MTKSRHGTQCATGKTDARFRAVLAVRAGQAKNASRAGAKAERAYFTVDLGTVTVSFAEPLVALLMTPLRVLETTTV